MKVCFYLSVVFTLVAMVVPRLLPLYPRRYRACFRLGLAIVCLVLAGVVVRWYLVDIPILELYYLYPVGGVGLFGTTALYLLFDSLPDVTMPAPEIEEGE